MKKRILLLFTLLAIGCMLPEQIQARRFEEVIHLKNGSIIRGTVIDQGSNESIKVRTRDGNIFVFNLADIKLQTKEFGSGHNSARGKIRRRSLFNQPHGYMRLLELGSGIGAGRGQSCTAGSLTFINGYRVLPQFAVGVGIGVQTYIFNNNNYWDEYRSAEVSMPIFLHLRSDFIDAKVSPYASFSIGYNLSNDYYNDGIMVETVLGIGFNVGTKRMLIGLGLTFGDTNSVYHFDGQIPGDVSYAGSLSALNLKVGYSF